MQLKGRGNVFYFFSDLRLRFHPFFFAMGAGFPAFHGFFFQVIEENGKAPAYRAWKDTYNLKPKTTVKIAWMPDNRPGTWMYHCHIIEHQAAGMMANFEVVDGSKPQRVEMQTHTHHHHHG